MKEIRKIPTTNLKQEPVWQILPNEVQKVIRGPWADLPKKQRKTWAKFLSGIWLEDALAEIIAKTLPSGETLVQGIFFKKPGVKPDFEIDLIVIRKNRLFCLSCTTEARSEALGKGKVFEVNHRATQIGGDLARSCVVSLLPASKVSELNGNLQQAWGSPVQPKIWSIDDCQQWLNDFLKGTPSPTLAAWLELEED